METGGLPLLYVLALFFPSYLRWRSGCSFRSTNTRRWSSEQCWLHFVSWEEDRMHGNRKLPSVWTWRHNFSFLLVLRRKSPSTSSYSLAFHGLEETTLLALSVGKFTLGNRSIQSTMVDAFPAPFSLKLSCSTWNRQQIKFWYSRNAPVGMAGVGDSLAGINVRTYVFCSMY